MQPKKKDERDVYPGDGQTGAGGGRRGAQTGPKGVMADRAAHDRSARLEKEQAGRERDAYLLSKAMVGMTVEEEARAREEEQRAKEGREVKEKERATEEDGENDDDDGDEELRRWRAFRRRELQKEHEHGRGVGIDTGSMEGGLDLKRGGLREVGKDGFLSAVEASPWVVVLIYEPVCRFSFSHWRFTRSHKSEER